MSFLRNLIALLIFSITPIYATYNAYPYQFEGNFEAWEKEKNHLISLFLPSDPIIIAAGGHYGNEALLFAKHWPKSKIYAFEPNPHAFKLLTSAVSDTKNISIFPYALNRQAGVAPFYICHGSDGNNLAFEHASSLLPPSQHMKKHYQGPVIAVECVNLDDWCKIHNLNQVDFIRLNLQGSEYDCLQSSPQILKMAKVIHVVTLPPSLVH